VAVESAVI